MPAPHESSGLRDARLHQALLHAPDADICPPDGIREAILQAAQKTTHTRRITGKYRRFLHIFAGKTGNRPGLAWQGSAFTAAAIAILTMSVLLWQQPASQPPFPADIATAPIAQAPKPAPIFSTAAEESAVTLPPQSAVLAQGKIVPEEQPSYSELSASQSVRAAGGKKDISPSAVATNEVKSREFADAVSAITSRKAEAVQNSTPPATLTAAPEPHQQIAMEPLRTTIQAGNQLTNWTRLYRQDQPHHSVLRTQAATLAELVAQLKPSDGGYSEADKNEADKSFTPDYTLVLMRENETLGVLQLGAAHWLFTPAQDAEPVQSGQLADNLRSRLYTALQHSLAQPSQPEQH